MNVTRLYARTGAAVQILPTQTSRSLLNSRLNLRSYATSAPPAPGHHPHNNRVCRRSSSCILDVSATSEPETNRYL
ncbi:uncharacterized protein N7503_003375 [Penicillium pulvis]|uniref:uncharacterized protein n=1 Tax=Penicillium pulvis TaxID=1562058 RepID=UPI002547CB77|nr:uncharacterized protein N7503_003375 [Penicillium pulvis]KAJ5805773.1 hypothetical protein N7503_003375 [Penicillium pulvis]